MKAHTSEEKIFVSESVRPRLAYHLKKKLYLRSFLREDLEGSFGCEKVPIFSPENVLNESSPTCLKIVPVDRSRSEMYGTE